MPESHTLITYLVVLTGFVFFPGPSILLTLARASTAGLRTGVATSLGIAAGDVLHTLLAVAGISAVLMASAEAFTAIKLLGAGYLIWIGLRSLTEHAAPGLPAAAPLRPARAFRQALLAEALNPKSAMFFLAFLPQFVDPARGAVALQLTILGLLFVAMGTVATMTVALAAGRVAHLLRAHPGIGRWQGRVVGTLYCALGLRLALAER
jgi:threonine/homoserine/homoserine lactone efflux protein